MAAQKMQIHLNVEILDNSTYIIMNTVVIDFFLYEEKCVRLNLSESLLFVR